MDKVAPSRKQRPAGSANRNSRETGIFAPTVRWKVHKVIKKHRQIVGVFLFACFEVCGIFRKTTLTGDGGG